MTAPEEGDLQTPPVAHMHCGFVALLGAPNAGKSTLLNTVVGAKVSIVSPKVQTTRTRVLGIAIADNSQLIFVDTPGIFAPRRRLDRAMVSAAWDGAADADIVCLLVDVQRNEKTLDPDTRQALDKLAGDKRPVVLILNKIDLISPPSLLALTQRLHQAYEFAETFMISALTGDGVDDLMKFVTAAVPQGPWLYPADQLSDMPDRLLAAEITREKLFLRLRQELPYALTVETESWDEKPDGSVRIQQIIYVRRDNQRAIVLGKGGQQIKSVGAAARSELQDILQRDVHLFLFVKVRDSWQNDPERYRDWGLDYNA